MFTLAISFLTTSSLPWFVYLTFHVPMQQCSLQHWTLPSPPVTSTTGHCFHLGSISSFFLELFLCSSSVAYWAPTDLGGSSSVAYLFVFSYCLWGSQGKNTEVVCHSLLQWSTFCQNSPPWPVHFGWLYKAWRRKWQPTLVFSPGESHGWRSLVGYSARGHKESDTTVTSLHLHSMAHSFIELDKAMVMWSDWLVFCDCGFQSVFPLMKKDRRLMEASWCERLTEGETGSCSDGWGHAQ